MSKEAEKYYAIMSDMRSGRIYMLDEAAQKITDFPHGIDDFHGRSWIINAIRSGVPACVRWMIGKDILLNFRDDEGFTVLHTCIESVSDENSRREIVNDLIHAGADLNIRGLNDWTPLHMAAIRGDALVVRMLLDAGADPTLRTSIDDLATPAEEAEFVGQLEIAKIIRDHISRSQRNLDRRNEES